MQSTETERMAWVRLGVSGCNASSPRHVLAKWTLGSCAANARRSPNHALAPRRLWSPQAGTWIKSRHAWTIQATHGQQLPIRIGTAWAEHLNAWLDCLSSNLICLHSVTIFLSAGANVGKGLLITPNWFCMLLNTCVREGWLGC